jgi:hypothetical protein
VDGGPAKRLGPDVLDDLNHLAKVRVAGSNPVFRSKIELDPVWATAVIRVGS